MLMLVCLQGRLRSFRLDIGTELGIPIAAFLTQLLDYNHKPYPTLISYSLTP